MCGCLTVAIITPLAFALRVLLLGGYPFVIIFFVFSCIAGLFKLIFGK